MFHIIGVMRIFDIAVTYLVGFILLIMVLLLPFDAYQFLQDPSSYISIHELDTSKDYWQMQYLGGSVLWFLGAIIVLAIVFYSFKYQEKRILVTIRQFIVWTLLVLYIYNFYQWSLTGFDH